MQMYVSQRATYRKYRDEDKQPIGDGTANALFDTLGLVLIAVGVGRLQPTGNSLVRWLGLRSPRLFADPALTGADTDSGSRCTSDYIVYVAVQDVVAAVKEITAEGSSLCTECSAPLGPSRAHWTVVKKGEESVRVAFPSKFAEVDVRRFRSRAIFSFVYQRLEGRSCRSWRFRQESVFEIASRSIPLHLPRAA